MTEQKECGGCARYVSVFENMGVCPCAYFLFSQEFTGIKPDTPADDSACEGQSYEPRNAKDIHADIQSAMNRLDVIRSKEQERYMGMTDGERLGENGWDCEETINDVSRAITNLAKADNIVTYALG